MGVADGGNVEGVRSLFEDANPAAVTAVANRMHPENNIIDLKMLK